MKSIETIIRPINRTLHLFKKPDFYRKLRRFIFSIICVFFLALSLLIYFSGDSQYTKVLKTNSVNDVSQINPFQMKKIIQVRNLAQISNAIKASTGPISIGGGRFSQGGQIAYPNSLHFDMRRFDQILNYQPSKKTITVQAGITWRKIQERIDQDDLSVQIMQSYANFTVGGSLSVNAHGRYLGKGPLVSSVESIKIILADGRIVSASPTRNSSIFYGAIGGYGGLGVIVEARLRLDANHKVERQSKMISTPDYIDYFAREVRFNSDITFHNANIYPPNYNKMRAINWIRSTKELTQKDRLTDPNDSNFSYFEHWMAISGIGHWLRQYIIEPWEHRKNRVVWRNWEASHNLNSIEPPNRSNYTYGLREYFIPLNNFELFFEEMKSIFKNHKANILNLSIRHATKDPGTYLAWAQRDVFSFVVYYIQGTDREAKEKVSRWSKAMIHAAIKYGGTFYLPYQIHANQIQFERAYPGHVQFFKLKNKLDPNNRFRNQLWKTYYPKNQNHISKITSKLKEYRRNEEQSILSIPKWYVVFNQKEYSEFTRKKPPHQFPFLASIDEYWSLYDRSIQIQSSYPPNKRYKQMLKLTGLIFSLEYFTKSLYENTVGRLTWLISGTIEEDYFSQRMNRAYSKFIYHSPWHQFPFIEWLKNLWKDNSFFGNGFIRKIERKIFYSIEYSVKALYGKALSMALESGSETQNKYTYVLLSNISSKGLSKYPELKLIQFDKGTRLIRFPRYVPFGENVYRLSKAKVAIKEVAGNDEIALSFICPKKFNGTPKAYLFDSRILTRENTATRKALFIPLSSLREAIQTMETNHCFFEHIYDY